MTTVAHHLPLVVDPARGGRRGILQGEVLVCRVTVVPTYIEGRDRKGVWLGCGQLDDGTRNLQCCKLKQCTYVYVLKVLQEKSHTENVKRLCKSCFY